MEITAITIFKKNINDFSWTRQTMQASGKILYWLCCYFLVSQSCLILCNPVDYSLPGSSVHGISQARILEWVVIALGRWIQRLAVWNLLTRAEAEVAINWLLLFVVQPVSHVWLFAIPWTAASLSFTISQSLLIHMSIELADAIRSSHLLSLPSPPVLNLFQHQGQHLSSNSVT